MVASVMPFFFDGEGGGVVDSCILFLKKVEKDN